MSRIRSSTVPRTMSRRKRTSSSFIILLLVLLLIPTFIILCLHVEDTFFDRAADDEPEDADCTVLADAVGAVDGLRVARVVFLSLWVS